MYIIVILQNKDSNHTVWMKQQSLVLPIGKLKKKCMTTELIKLGNLGHWWLYMSVALKS